MVLVEKMRLVIQQPKKDNLMTIKNKYNHEVDIFNMMTIQQVHCIQP